MKKLVLCGIHAKYIHSAPALWYLDRAIQNLPLDHKIIEWTINGYQQELIERLLAEKADFIGFSCYIWNITYVSQVAREIRRIAPHITLIFGGPEITYRIEDFLQKNDFVDFAIGGEGEKPLRSLMDCLISHKEIKNIPGVYYRDDKGVIQGCVPEIPKEWPDFPMEEYARTLKNRIAYLETSRGCPFSCAFCLSGVHEPVRFQNFEQSLENIRILAASGVKTIKFVDRTFNCNRKRAYDLFAFLIKNAGILFPKDLRFHFEVGADLFDEATLDLLQQAPDGLFQMEAGLQSFNECTLREVQRKTDLLLLQKNLRRLIGMGTIHVHIDLIAGLPYEPLSSFETSFNKAFALRPHMLQLGFLKLIYGSKLRKDYQRYGYEFDENAPYEFIRNKWMNQVDSEELHLVEDALERMYNSHRFLWTIEYLLKVTGFSPYDLFYKIGNAVYTPGIGLDQYTELIYQYFLNLPGVDAEKLRDVMACDRLASNPSGKLPYCLRRFDDRLKGLSQKYSKKCNGRAGTTILYSEKNLRVFCADYGKKDPIWDRYTSFIEDFDEIGNIGNEV